MHIGLLTPDWPLRASTNGIVTYVHWMRQGLLARGHRVSIFTLTPHEVGECNDLHVVAPPTTSFIRRALGKTFDLLGSDIGRNISRQVLAVHRRCPIDVFEMEESFGWFLPLARAGRFPVVVKLHGPAFLSMIEEERNTSFAERKIRAEGEALQQAHAITSPSECTLADTLRRYALNPAISAHIVNPLGLASDAPTWTADDSDRDSLLFVGRFDKRKGGDRVLAIFQKMLSQRPGLKLTIVGFDAGIADSMGHRRHFAEYAGALMSTPELERVTFLGRQPPDVVAQLRTRSAAVLVASRWESQGYTALEAMAQACPVVCADNSGLREAIINERNGLLFADDDIDGAVRQTFRLIDEPGFATGLGERAREDVLAKHDPQHVADQTLRLYDRVRTMASRQPIVTPTAR